MPDPDRWRAIEQRRRKLAERLAWDLAHPDPAKPGAMSDFVAGTVVRVRWASAIDAHAVFDEAGSLIAFGGDYRLIEGRGGVVLVLHCPQDSMYDWSLVVRYEPFRTPVLVCLDDMGEHCMGIYADSPEARQALSDLHVRLIGGFANRQHAKDIGFLPPDA